MSSYAQEEQVFASEEIDPSQLYKNVWGDRILTAKTSKNQSTDTQIEMKTTITSDIQKRFRADNGTKYVWDDEEDCWVQDEDASERSDDERNDNEESDDDELQDFVSNIKSSSSNNLNNGDHNNADGAPAAETQKRKRKQKKKNKKVPNNWIYISGLPSNITVEEIKSHFCKVGLIAISPHDQMPKIKIYLDEEGSCKGDASLCYNANESVEMAVNYLDGGYIRPSYMLKVTKAEFNFPTETNTGVQNSSSATSTGATTSTLSSTLLTGSSQATARRPKVSHAQVKVAKAAMNQALSWSEADDIGVSRSQALKIIVLQGMFRPSDFSDPSFSDELEQDVASECSKCGDIEKITVFSQNIKGIVIVKFSKAYAAQECIKLMDGRFFGGQKLRCFYWDGSTNYTVTASEETVEKEEEARLDEFGDWLDKDQEDLPEEFQLNTE